MGVPRGGTQGNQSGPAFPDGVACVVACDEMVVVAEVPDDAVRLRLEVERETHRYGVDSVDREPTEQRSALVEHGGVEAVVSGQRTLVVEQPVPLELECPASALELLALAQEGRDTVPVVAQRLTAVVQLVTPLVLELCVPLREFPWKPLLAAACTHGQHCCPFLPVSVHQPFPLS